jgi:hypothetical protein
MSSRQVALVMAAAVAAVALAVLAVIKDPLSHCEGLHCHREMALPLVIRQMEQ